MVAFSSLIYTIIPFGPCIGSSPRCCLPAGLLHSVMSQQLLGLRNDDLSVSDGKNPAGGASTLYINTTYSSLIVYATVTYIPVGPTPCLGTYTAYQTAVINGSRFSANTVLVTSSPTPYVLTYQYPSVFWSSFSTAGTIITIVLS